MKIRPDFCLETIEWEPEPCMGRIVVQCLLYRDHEAPHEGRAEVGDWASRQTGRTVVADIRARWPK